nr:ferritin-like protein 3 [Novocrania anomala]
MLCCDLKEIMASQCRQNYNSESEAGINRQINLDIHASYVYQSIAWYFHRDDVALPGYHQFFTALADDHKQRGETLMEFQNRRGGRIVLKDIDKPAQDEWGSGVMAMDTALTLAKKVNQSYLDLHSIASQHNDAQMMDFIDSNFLNKQVEIIKKISDYATSSKNVGPGLGEYQFDKQSLKEK